MGAFRIRGFAALWAGALVSNIGTWMSMVTLGVLVTEQTGKALWTGAVAAMTFVPAVILAPVAGALADRFERRRYVATLNLAQMGIAATLTTLAFTGRLSVGAIAILTFATGCLNALTSPGFVALISELVPSQQLPSAFSMNSVQYNLGRIVGPALATAMFAWAGAPWAFLGNTLSFLGVVIALTFVPLVPRPSRPRSPLWIGIREGMRTAREDPGIRLSLTAVLAIAFLVAPFIGLIPVFALTELHGTRETASIFTTAQGAGAVVAALMIAPLASRFGMKKTAWGFVTLLGPCALAYWMAPTPEIATLLLPVLGGTYLASLTSLNTIEQLRSVRDVQARISSLHSMVLGGGYALGLVVCGALSDMFGIRAVMGTLAVIFFFGAIAVRFALPNSLNALNAGVEAPVTART